MILISVAFGVGYISVFNTIKDNDRLIGAEWFNLVLGIISCYMLCDVKQIKDNQMGSY